MSSKHKHIVMFSGGIGSYATAKRVAERHGTENLYLVFADVKGNAESPHLGEDSDTYRFITEAHRVIGGELVHLKEGRDIWQVFKDNRFLGNSRLANCSKFLKQRPSREWLEANCDPEDSTVYIGIDWTEVHRIPAIESAYLPYRAVCPMTEAPYLDKQEMIEMARADGIEPPRLYSMGFPHNNCGGFCVRAGHGQFKILLEKNRDAYLFHERKEQELREYLGKDVAILRSRKGGVSRPVTLREFRESRDPIDMDDIGGCGCFVDEGEDA